MATKRIKDISTTATTFAADDFIALDASSVGTRKMAKASLITQVGANYLEKADNLSDVASKDTAKLNLEIPDIGLQANQVPLSGMLNSGAWVDWDSHYSEGTWAPTVSFGGGSTGVTYSIQEGYYTKTGNIVTVAGTITLSSKGSDNGTFNIKGLPYTAKNTSGSYQSGTVGYASSMSSLTGALTMLFLDNDTAIQLQTWTSTGVSILTDVNFNATSNLRFSGTYQIA